MKRHISNYFFLRTTPVKYILDRQKLKISGAENYIFIHATPNL